VPRSATQTVEVNVNSTNHAPVAADDTKTTAEDTTLIASVPASSDSDGDDLTYQLVDTTPGLAFSADGSYTYAPLADFSGTRSFTYRASDGIATSNLATVTITVTPVNDPPTAVGDTATVAEDHTVTVDVAANDSAGPANENGQTLTYALAEDALHGSVGCSTSGSCTYTPDPNYFGADSFTYALSDGDLGGFATVHVTVTAVNDPPVAGDDSIELLESSVLTFETRANDSRGPANESGQTLGRPTITSPPAHGAVLVNADGTIRYTPTSAYAGPDSFEYEVCDNGTTNGSPDAQCDRATVSATVTSVADEVEDLVEANPGTPLADKVEDALVKLEKAEEKLAQTPPDRQGALGEYEGAVGELEAAVKDGLLTPAQGNALMNSICGTARKLAEDAIAAAVARNGNAGKITEARQRLTQGDTFRAAGRFKDAIARYKDAVSKAEGA
jgi:hypothetical protein